MIAEVWASVTATETAPATQGTAWWFPLVTGFGGTIVGFLLKVVSDWGTGKRQEDQQFQVAALLVSDELRANVVKLEIALQTSEDPESLASDAYHRHELILARRLPSEARDSVRAAYIHARVHRAFQVRSNQGEWVGQTPVVRDALDKARSAREQLRSYGPKDATEI